MKLSTNSRRMLGSALMRTSRCQLRSKYRVHVAAADSAGSYLPASIPQHPKRHPAAALLGMMATMWKVLTSALQKAAQQVLPCHLQHYAAMICTRACVGKINIQSMCLADAAEGSCCDQFQHKTVCEAFPHAGRHCSLCCCIHWSEHLPAAHKSHGQVSQGASHSS